MPSIFTHGHSYILIPCTSFKQSSIGLPTIICVIRKMLMRPSFKKKLISSNKMFVIYKWKKGFPMNLNVFFLRTIWSPDSSLTKYVNESTWWLSILFTKCNHVILKMYFHTVGYMLILMYTCVNRPIFCQYQLKCTLVITCLHYIIHETTCIFIGLYTKK